MAKRADRRISVRREGDQVTISGVLFEPGKPNLNGMILTPESVDRAIARLDKVAVCLVDTRGVLPDSPGFGLENIVGRVMKIYPDGEAVRADCAMFATPRAEATIAAAEAGALAFNPCVIVENKDVENKDVKGVTFDALAFSWVSVCPVDDVQVPDDERGGA